MDALTQIEPTNWIILLTALITLGSFAGFLAGLLGVGGGVVLVPGLLFIFTLLGYDSPHMMHLAVGTSLAIIVPTGFSSARAHWKKSSVDLPLIFKIGTGIIIGVIGGTILAKYLSGDALKLIFATALVILAAIMASNIRDIKLLPTIPGRVGCTVAGSIIGLISTLIGVGGATLSVPFMTLCKIPIRKAIGTASGLGLVISIPAALGFILIGWNSENLPPLSFGYVNLAAWLTIIPFSILVAPLGVAAAHKIPVERLRLVFAIFMILVSIKLWTAYL